MSDNQQQQPTQQIARIDLTAPELQQHPQFKLLGEIHTACVQAYRMPNLSFQNTRRFRALQRQVQKRMVLLWHQIEFEKTAKDGEQCAVQDVNIVVDGNDVFDDTEQIDKFLNTRTNEYLLEEANRMIEETKQDAIDAEQKKAAEDAKKTGKGKKVKKTATSATKKGERRVKKLWSSPLPPDTNGYDLLYLMC